MKNFKLNLKSIVQSNARGKKRKEEDERVLTMKEASVQHPFSIHSAPIQHPLQSGGNQEARGYKEARNNQEARGYAARVWKYAAMLLMILTLGVGQMWADDGDFYNMYIAYSFEGAGGAIDGDDNNTGVTVDAGTLTSGSLTLTGVYLKCWDDWGSNYKSSGGLLGYTNKGGSAQELLGFTRSGKSGNNYEYQNASPSLTIASYTQASGSYAFECWGKTWGWGDRYFPKSSGHYVLNYKIAPPAVSSFSVSEANHLAGDGSKENPYILPYNGTLSLSISGSQAHTDGNSSAQYYNTSSSNAWSTTATKSISSVTSTTATSVTVKMRYYNSTASLGGAESSKQIWYKSEAAYSVTVSSGAHGSVSPSGAQSNIGTLSGLSISATPSTGYNFNTWTISSGSGSFTSAATTASNKFKPTAASTITASFTAKQTTVTLSANAPGGQTVTGGGTTVTATYDSALPSFSALTCTGGYALKGYYTNTSGGTKVINADGSFNANSGIWNRLDGATLTLHAQWSLDRTLTYSGNGNTSGDVPAEPAVYANGASATVLGNTGSLAKTGYTFNNWNTEAGGGGSSYSAGNTITMNANYTLYAQWRENNYTVTVNAGSNGSVASGSVTGHIDTKVTLPTATPNTGYHFNTWTTTSGSVTYTNQTSASTAQVNGLTAAATVRADFAANTYSVVFNKNGGSGTMSNQSFTYNEAAKALTSNSFTRSGYTFLGWATTAEKANALTVDYTNGQSVQNLTSTNGGTFNLYAVWAKKYYIGGRFQHDWEDDSTTTNEMTYDASTGYYKFTTSKTVSELSAQWHNVSGNYDADQVFFIHTGTGKVGSSSNPFYTTPNEDGAGLNFETSNSYSNALVLANQETSWGEIVTNRCVQFSNIDNLSSSVIVWWDPANKKIWYTATESLNTNYYLLGFGSGNWSTTDARRFTVASVNASTATVSVSLTAKTYTGNDDGFKLYYDTWYGNNGTMTRANCSGWVFSTSEGNCGITADLAGTYTFTLNLSTKAISVTYPTAYQLNYSIGSVAGTYGSITTDPSTTSGSYVGSGNSVTLTGPAAKTGYTWSGWFTNAAGTEGQIADDSRAITVTMNADKTLYACYTENAYATTVSAGSNGSVSPSGSVNIKQITGTSLTATPSTGYHFVDWSISGGGITPGTSSSATQTFKATETGGTIQANFAEDMHTVTVASNNTAFGTVSTSSVSAGIATASTTITATPATGATFTGWSLPGSGVTIVAPATSSSASITIKATADSKSITANFTEDMNTVTLTNQNSTYGDVYTSSPVSAGQITAVQIRATPESGYMFAGWVKTAGTGTVTYHTVAGTGAAVDPTGNTQATTYITVDGDVTLQATWDEDRSSGWFMRGVWTDGWSETGEKPFIKNVGETTGTVSHVRWTLDPRNFDNAILEMKVYDGSKYWAHWSVIDASENLCTKASNNSNIGFYQDDNNKNFRISIEVYGEYDFEWDSSTKQLTVHYPNGNFIRGDFNSWGWEDVLTATGNPNEFAGTINLDANQTWSAPTNGFKAVILGDHYGKDGTTITRASNSANSLSTSGANIGMTTDVAGNYTFTINTSTKNLSVTYPTAYTVTFGYGVGGSAVSASATSRAGSFASGGYVAAGDDITFTQTPAAGYTFKGWYTASTGGSEIASMASDNVFDDIGGNITVYAQYTPTTYTNVTLNATTGSTNGAYSVTFGGNSLTVTTEPLKTGYQPEGYYYSYSDATWTEKVATPAGQLQASTHYTDGSQNWTATNSPTLYTKWQAKTYAITLDDNGSYVSDGSATATYDSNTLTSITAPQRTGYSVEGYYKEAGCTNLIATPAGALQADKDGYTGAGGIWQKDAIATLYANWTANRYDVALNANGGEGAGVTVSATYDSAMPGSDNTSTALVAPTKTGYDFDGYYDAADGGTQYYTSALASARAWDKDANSTLYAHWTAKSYTVTLDQQSSVTGHSADGTLDATKTVTYDAALPAISGTVPTAANGYAFMGFYTGELGTGVKLVNVDKSWVASVDGYTDAESHWVRDVGNVTLYAYYKKAEVATLTLSSAVVAPGSDITATATISPTPEGTTVVCWSVLYSNDNPLDPQPTFTPESGNSVTFTAPAASGTYKVKATLRTGSTCGSGTELSTQTVNFQVAGDHTVSILYKDASGNTLQPYTTVTGKPLEWTEITAPDIFGYDFTRWEAGDGITLSEDKETTSSTSGVRTIWFEAIYDGSLTAVYTQRNLIYFKNTLGWESVFVNFYTGEKWNNPKGSGNNGLTHGNNEMTQIEGTDIWYYDYQSASITPSLYVSFTGSSQDGSEYFWADPEVKVVYPAHYADDINTDKSSENGFKAATPMFIPLAGQTPVTLNASGSGKANYYNSGYWTTYIPGTGYTLEIYNEAGNSLLKSLSFTSADDLMPMKVTVDLEASTTYSFQVRRGGTSSAGIYYGSTGTMTYAEHGAGIGWEMSNTMGGGFQKAKITTTAAGEYTYNLSYSANASSAYRLRMCVDYPIGDGDYRLIYTDNTRDSGTRYKPSAIVNKVAGGKDTVSFFIRKASSPVLRIQKATVAVDGTITWSEYPTPTPPATYTNQLTSAILSGLPKDSVYNICLTMDENGDISVETVVGYSGYYYIRTDAANSKWDNYRASDHMMTYSEYSEKNSTFTHYFTQYVTNGTNVKFVIANDYAPSISDTLSQQTSDVTPNHVDAGGYVQADANVRFMWDIRDNAVSRTYLAAAKEDGTKFLVLRGQASELLASDGSALVGESKEYPGNNHGAGANCIQFVDDDNWIYETTVQIEPSSFVKLYAKFHGEDIYYRGLDNATFDKDNAIQLVSGTGGAVQVRIIYDFKTDRIISALIPSGTITEDRAINADVMFIREGQDDINQISFTGSGQLTKIKSAYGILRLNKWTLNNKDKSTHAVLGEELSVYERAMYFISFPFKVKLNEVFGFGTYGTDWVVQRYRGDLRAQQGFWAESEGFWEFIWDRRNVVLEPYEGYLLQIELGNFRESTSPFWNNGVENIELFFPSDGEMPDITSSSVALELPAHECTINRMGEVHNGVTLGPDYDRRVTDSHWNVMSVPTYINNDDITFANTTWTTAHPNFLYEWNKNDNTLTAISGSSYEYHAMHAYIVQYAGKVTWDAKSSSPYSSIVARKTYEEAPQDVEFRIELQQNDRMVDQTYISLSNDEAVTSEFEFGYDLSKEKSSRKANIYTLIGYVPAAGNSLPLSEQTTVVPVGVQIPASGDYTFAIPDGTSGIGVTLIDTETGIRTSLSALDYTIQLNAGTYESRFLIEISPVQNTPTGIEEVPSDGVQSTKAHKMLIDNLLYIVKDGKMYDARGARVE